MYAGEMYAGSEGWNDEEYLKIIKRAEWSKWKEERDEFVRMRNLHDKQRK
jgi:hypothetical protein